MPRTGKLGVGGPAGDPALQTTPLPDSDDRHEGRRTGGLPLKDKIGTHTRVLPEHGGTPAPITERTPR
jgi:hypothetical protein